MTWLIFVWVSCSTEDMDRFWVTGFILSDNGHIQDCLCLMSTSLVHELAASVHFIFGILFFSLH